MGLPRPAVILLMEWVCGYRGACKLPDLLLGSWPAEETVCFGRAKGCPTGLQPTNCCSRSASAVVLFFTLLLAMQTFMVQTRPHLLSVP